MHQPECGTNYAYFVDFIQVCLSAKLLNSEEIGRLYLEEKLSLNQIASKFKVSRSAIMSRLRSLGIELIKREGRNHSEVARVLTRRGLKTRTGKAKWNSKTIFNIFKRWKDTL